MILTIKENYNKNDGGNLPMFSRSGKSTINQFLAFNSLKKRPLEQVKYDKAVEDYNFEHDDIGIMMDER